MTNNETPAERLRKIAGTVNATNEFAFDGLTIQGIINLVEACWACDWDIYPDMLPKTLRLEASLHGANTEVVTKINTCCEELEKEGRL